MIEDGIGNLVLFFAELDYTPSLPGKREEWGAGKDESVEP
jgi:hypothetical protein